MRRAVCGCRYARKMKNLETNGTTEKKWRNGDVNFSKRLPIIKLSSISFFVVVVVDFIQNFLSVNNKKNYRTLVLVPHIIPTNIHYTGAIFEIHCCHCCCCCFFFWCLRWIWNERFLVLPRKQKCFSSPKTRWKSDDDVESTEKAKENTLSRANSMRRCFDEYK